MTALKKQKTPAPQTPTPLDGPTPEEALLREVDEAMRQERLQDLWDQYGNWVIGGIIIIITSVALGSFIRSMVESRNQKATAEIVALTQGEEINITDLPRDQATLARLLALPNAEAEQQQALADALAETASDPAARQLGQLLAIRLSDAPAAERLQALDSLINATPSYYAALAAIDAAAIAGEGLNDTERANSYLDKALTEAEGHQDLIGLINRLRLLYPSETSEAS